MQRDAYFEIGIITRASGFKGDVAAKIDSDNPIDYKTLESVFVETTQGPVPFFISQLIIKNNGKARIKFEGIDTEDDANRLKGAALLLPDSFLPELTGTDFYYHEITGFDIHDVNDGFIGTLDQVMDGKAQDLFSIIKDGKEILIPVIDELIVDVDRNEKRLTLNIPEGLVDFYLNET